MHGAYNVKMQNLLQRWTDSAAAAGEHTAHLSNQIGHTGYCKELNLSDHLMFHMTYRYLVKCVNNTITPILS